MKNVLTFAAFVGLSYLFGVVVGLGLRALGFGPFSLTYITVKALLSLAFIVAFVWRDRWLPAD